ncbi:glucose dehydrogenase [FAD, quinone]-like [Homalodisca vitripennis]|uniref:glucose dehydrogenase [FAD, quinone]-like n=1 Tax=Homalodisca vitripennis TaxID=197043 RepID=UPI001EEB3E89|nr:glucose dehydrogenase [FAD, quinone]-like [Homalodisca vitripennis]
MFCASLAVLLLLCCTICYCAVEQCGETREKHSHWLHKENTCSDSQDDNDFGSSLIKDIYTSVKKAECDLANPSDYPPHYSPREGEEFDFIIVGSGSAGAVIANRLSEISEWNILLLEAGGNPTKTTEIPGAFMANCKSELDWQYQTDRYEDNCLGMVNSSCSMPRGKVLGGTSTINANIYVRGNRRDFDSWATAGNEGWEYENVLKYFKKSENIKAKEVLKTLKYQTYHGENGFLTVDSWNEYGLEGLINAFVEGMKELGYNTNMDVNGESQTGFAKVQGTIIDGKRCSTAKAFLSPIKNRSNLKISKHSLVTKIMVDQKSMTAHGVEFMDNLGKEIRIRARKEVIISAGAINSPQLLMLSGIGPRKHLEELGIEVIQDLPVGEKLEDHMIMVGLVFSFNYTREVKSITDYMYDFLKTNSSKLSGVGMLGYSTFINTLDNKNYLPDMQIHHGNYDVNDVESLDLFFDRFGLREEIRKQYHEINANRHIALLLPTLLRPASTGKILLSSTDPTDKPRIITGFLTKDDDFETFLRTTEFISKFSRTKAMRKLDTQFHEIAPPACTVHPLSSKEFRKCALRHLTSTAWHQTSTCKMGPEGDPTAVVNPQLQVRGVRQLRVADASIMPSVVSGNTNAAAIMIGEKAADLIKESWL